MDLLPDSFRNAHLWPLLLIGLLPLLLHLLDRRRAHRVSWPAMRFLPTRDPRLMRRVRAREALLVASRTAALLLIALALLRPVSSSAPPAAAAGLAGAPRGVVLVIDTSPSMGYRQSAGGPSSLDVAREAALRILEDLRPDDPVAVVLGRGDPGRDDDHDDDDDDERRGTDRGGAAAAVRAAIAGARPGGAPFSLERALDRALEKARLQDAPAREIRIFTDLQRGTLDEDNGRLRLLASRLESFFPRPRLGLIDCGASTAANRAVHVAEPPALVAGTDEPVELRFTVSTSEEPREGDGTESVTFRLLVGERVVEERLLPGSPGSQEIALEHRFESPGPRRIRGEITADGLRSDDTAHLALGVRDRLEVLIIGSPERSAYLEKALWPKPPGHPPPETILRVRSRRAGSLEERDLAAADVIIVHGLRSPLAGETRHLEEHLRRGKGVIFFAGPAASGDAWTRRLFRGGLGPLPAAIGDPVSATSGALHPGAIDATHPVLAPFSSPEEGDLALIEVSSHRTTGELAREARVLARIEGGDPWILERPFEGGRVVLVTTSATPGDSDLPLTPLFPPLVHRLVRYVAAGPDPPPAATGAAIEHVLPPGTDPSSVSVVDPQDARHPVLVTRRDGRLTAVFQDARSPGFYRFEIEGALSALRAVNVPPEESDLRRIDEPRLGSLVDLLGVELVGRSEAEAPRPRVETSREYWPHAAAISLIALLAELFLVASIARRQPAREGAGSR